VRILNRKNQLQRLLDSVGDSLDLPREVKRLPSLGSGSGKAMKTGLLAAGGLAGLTAGSAGISSLRRQRGEERDDS
jgi:hypothetical protein